MADPVNNILAPESAPASLDQDDPAHFEEWAKYHERQADRLAEQEPGSTQRDRLGELMGELDHRSAAEGFREQTALHERGRGYADEVRRVMAERGIVPPQRGSTDRTQEAVDDTLRAFRDYGIPDDLVGHAVISGDLVNKNAGEREDFVIQLLDQKRSLDDVASGDGPDIEVEGINDWKSAINATGASVSLRQESLSHDDKKLVDRTKKTLKEQEANRTEATSPDTNWSAWKDIISRAAQRPDSGRAKAGLDSANAHWAQSTSQLREKYPLLASNQEAEKIARAGARRAWLVDKIPNGLQRRVGLSSERSYNTGVEQAYQKLIDNKSDGLLKERTKVLLTLRDVDPQTPPHLLPSKQYRAAENLTRIDQDLRKLRPLPAAEYGVAIQTATGREGRDAVRQPEISKAPVKGARSAAGSHNGGPATGACRSLKTRAGFSCGARHSQPNSGRWLPV